MPTISGNCGIASGWINYATSSYQGNVQADGAGNYTTPNLTDLTTYAVWPSASGQIFSPVQSSVTFAGSNISGVNFNATAATLTTVFTDNFTRANENPLDPTHWTAVTSGGAQPCQVVTNTCQGTAAGFGCVERSTPIAWSTTQQFIQSTCTAISSGALNNVYLGAVPSRTTGWGILQQAANCQVYQGISLRRTFAHVFVSGDFIRMEYLGQRLDFWVNSTLIMSTFSVLQLEPPTIELDPQTTIASVQVTNVTVGTTGTGTGLPSGSSLGPGFDLRFSL